MRQDIINRRNQSGLTYIQSSLSISTNLPELEDFTTNSIIQHQSLAFMGYMMQVKHKQRLDSNNDPVIALDLLRSIQGNTNKIVSWNQIVDHFPIPCNVSTTWAINPLCIYPRQHGLYSSTLLVQQPSVLVKREEGLRKDSGHKRSQTGAWNQQLTAIRYTSTGPGSGLSGGC